MNWKKLIIFSFLLIIFGVSLQRVVINILNYQNLNCGIVQNVSEFTDTDGYNSMRSFYLINKKEEKYEGVYSEKDIFSLKKRGYSSFSKII